MPYDDKGNEKALIDRGWAQMEALLEEHQPRRRAAAWWLIWPVVLSLALVGHSERSYPTGSLPPASPEVVAGPPSSVPLSVAPEKRLVPYKPGEGSASEGHPAVFSPPPRQVGVIPPVQPLSPVPSIRHTVSIPLPPTALPALPSRPAVALEARAEPLTAPGAGIRSKGRWSVYLGGGPSSSLRQWVDGGWGHTRLQYALGRRWYVATGLDYQWGSYTASAGEHAQAANATEESSDPGTGFNPGILRRLPPQVVVRRHRVGIPLLTGFRLHPRWSLEAGGQISLLRESRRDEDAEPVTGGSVLAAGDPSLYRDLRSWEPALVAGMRWAVLSRFSLYASWQQSVIDLVPNEAYHARPGSLRLGLEIRL